MLNSRTTETELELYKSINSSFEQYENIIFYAQNNSFDTSSHTDEQFGKVKTPKNEEKLITLFEEYTRRILDFKQGEAKKTKEVLKKELISELKIFHTEDEDISSAERKIMEIVKTYSFSVLGDIIQSIYLEYNDYPYVLAGICKSLCRYDLEQVYPWGPTMLGGLLLHKSDIVKEYTVELIENWEDVKILPLLRNLECSTAWLKKYISNVVEYLEELNALHKEAR